MSSGEDRPLALVTGASSGIAHELAVQLAERGYDLVVCAEDAGIDEVADRFRNAGAQVEAVRVDLRGYGGVERLWAQVQAIGRPLSLAQ